MRIIELEFENINSYEGKIRIDFTDEAFRRNNNQFVICGETAAGKSTILDAISLALFGYTARMGRVVGSETVEILNNKSTECMSSIIYTCPKGRFKSTFSLKRARGKRDGKIQDPKCSIENLDTGEMIISDAKTNNLSLNTEDIIGLSYDQFIRCIVIPQGEFEIFIKSDEREKASILAKLSGTENYKKVAANLADKAAEIKNEYIQKAKSRDEIKVYTIEERAEKEDSLKALKDKVKIKEERLREIDSEIGKKTELQKARKEYEEAKSGSEAVKEGEAEYSENKTVLDKARKAVNCKGVYESLNKLKKDLSDKEVDSENAKVKLAETREELEKAKAKAEECDNKVASLKKEKEDKVKLWNEVRELDSKLSGLKATYDAKRGDATKAETELREKEKELEELKKSLETLKEETKTLLSYIEENKKDEGIAEVLAKIKEKHQSLQKVKKEIKKCDTNIKSLSKSLEEEESNNEVLRDEKDKLETELAAFISSKHAVIAGILREKLEKDKPCPVCGEIYHSDAVCRATEKSAEVTEARAVAAGTITELSDMLKDKESKIQVSDIAIEGLKKEIQKEEENSNNLSGERDEIISQINGEISLWDKTIDKESSEDEFGKIVSELQSKAELYNSKNEEYTDKTGSIKTVEAKIESIKIDSLKEAAVNSKKQLTDAEIIYISQKEKRESLFGTKIVSEEEEAFDKVVESKNSELNNANETLNQKKLDEQRINTMIVDFAEGIAKLNSDILESKNKFEALLKEYEFGAVEAFTDSIRSDTEINALDMKIREFEQRKKSADDALIVAKKKLDIAEAVKVSEVSLEELDKEKAEISKERDTDNQTIGSISNELTNDDENAKKREELSKNLEELSKENEIYKEITDMLGVKSGADFEVFVQSIAMRSLLGKANEYLSNILPQYTLIQKENDNGEKTADFDVREDYIDGTVKDRSIQNFSGGEKFIISLSFALAIAEFAGKNGSVDSIFLDEGFGTLSGQPLKDAIDALKKLSNTGKMLGIITHVEPVIQEFMQIEAKKIGDRSVLKGPGIYFEPKRIVK